jgi:hypothetical protein
MTPKRPLNIPAAWPNSLKAAIDGGQPVGPSTIRRAMGEWSTLPADICGPEFRIVILRTFTLETQLDAVRLALATIPCRPEVVLGALGEI